MFHRAGFDAQGRSRDSHVAVSLGSWHWRWDSRAHCWPKFQSKKSAGPAAWTQQVADAWHGIVLLHLAFQTWTVLSKICSFDQTPSCCRKISLKQHEAVAHLETGLKSMISEVDLRRALGLAFQEFENRIEDVAWLKMRWFGFFVWFNLLGASCCLILLYLFCQQCLYSKQGCLK